MAQQEFGWSVHAQQRERLSTALASSAAEPVHVYPWPDLEPSIVTSERRVLSLIGYGSLINRQSAAVTLTENERVAIIAFGVRRLFNYEMPAKHPRYGPPANPKARAALNVEVTYRLGDVANAIVIDVPLADVSALRDREKGYDLIQVPCIRWDRRDDTDARPFPAYILGCPREKREGVTRFNPDLEPHREYYRICREGAADISDAFLQLWLRTTFLSDGRTTAGAWEATWSS